MLVISRKGKSSRNPASAIGVQSTKKDQERIAARKPSSSPYFVAIKIKYPTKRNNTNINFASTLFLVSCFRISG